MIKKLVSLFVIALFIPQIAFGWGLQGFVGSDGNFPHGVTFVAVYDAGLDADYSVGSATATFAASRDATHPATYFDTSGVMQKTTTSNVGRFNYGYYNTTGWHAFTHAGVMVESASTNYLTYGIFSAGATLSTGWSDDSGTDSPPTYSRVVETLTNITDSKAQRIVYTGVGADVDAYIQLYQFTGAGSFAQNDNVTVSCWIKGSLGNVSIQLAYDEYTDVEGFLSSNIGSDIIADISSTEWRRFTYSHAVDEATCGQIVPMVYIDAIDNGDTIDIQVACFQAEKSPFASSFIPTTTAALTRNAETLKYATLGNCTAATETIVVKLAPEFASSTAQDFVITDTDAKQRYAKFNTGSDDVYVYPNLTDTAGCVVQDLINEAYTANAEMTLGWSVQSTGNPNVACYYNGVADGTDDNDDFTAPVGWTDFWVGSDKDGAYQVNSTILGYARFNRVLSAAEHLDLHNKDWRTLR